MLLLIVLHLLYLPLAVISLRRSSYFTEHLEVFPPTTVGILYGSFFLILVAYGFLIHHRAKFTEIPEWVILTPFIFGLIPAVLSRDCGLYLVAAHNFVQHGLNPHTVPIGAAVGDSWLQEFGDSSWPSEPTLYGPLFTIFSAPWGFLPTSLSFAEVLYKLFQAGLFILSGLLFGKLTAEKDLKLLYVTNPALIINLVIEGHNDLLVILCLLFVLCELKKGRTAVAGAVLGLSVAIKYISIIFLPLLFKKKVNVLVGILLTVAIPLFALSIFGISIKDMGTRLNSVSELRCLYSCSPPIIIFDRYFEPPFKFYVGKIVMLIGLTLSAIGYLKGSLSPSAFIGIALLFVLFFGTTWLTSWYLTLPLPFLLLNSDKSKKRDWYLTGTFLVSAYSLLHYFSV